MIGILYVYPGKELFVFICKIMQQIRHIRYPTTEYFHFDYHSSIIIIIIIFALLLLQECLKWKTACAPLFCISFLVVENK